LIPREPLSDVFLGHLELARTEFGDALSLEEARQRWADFQRPGDIVTVIRPGSAQLFTYLANANSRFLVLKSVDYKSLGLEIPKETAADIATAGDFGRASKRLALAIAWVRQLNALVNCRHFASKQEF
jgi:hypothetical protein